MQYKVPQEISGEDKLVYFLSLRQLIIVGVGGGIAYMMYISLARVADPIIYLPPMVIIVLITLAVAFFKKDNLTFTHMFFLLLESIINPPKRVWMQMGGDISPFTLLESSAQPDKTQADKKEEKTKEEKIEDISRLVQIIDSTSNEKIMEEQQQHWTASSGDEKSRTSMLENLLQASAKGIATEIKKKDL